MLSLAIGFYVIMLSPKTPGSGQLDPGLLTLGIALVVLGVILITHRRRTKKNDQR
ncbi:hypothetical protein ACFQ41_01195 [Lacticaseibacillus suilingensis]|uniref:LPXTG cell wall anchor domain-containing protein n=2 Tax=Lacticaseibacillus TaxID=2759736 RepID=A0ABW4BBN9_9LACO|nr:hypothetical protein [Lacticaseibacillus suibinensis]MCI2036705.1 hypothetical protein [Lactobacillus sp.]